MANRCIKGRFQKKVWSGLSEIPYGRDDTYGDLGKKIRIP